MPNEHRENEKQRREATQARDEQKRRGYVAQAREDEKRHREAAQATIAKVEPGGHEVPGRSIKQMVSVRLEAQLLKDLREFAEMQGVSISDLLRQAAVELVERSRTTSVLVRYGRAEAPSGITSALTARQATYGLTTSEEVQVSGNESVDVLAV